MSEKIAQFIERIEGALLMFIFFALPLYFSVFYLDFSVFSLNKTVFFHIVVEILFLILLLKVSLQGHIKIISIGKFKWVMALYVIALFLSVLFSIDKNTSFWGSYWRQSGLFTYLHYFTLFFITLEYFDNPKKVRKIFYMISLGGLLVSAYGIYQWLGLDMFPWYKKVPTFGRVISTIGQPVILANYLILVLPVTSYLVYWHRRSPRALLWWTVVALTTLFALIITYTRSAWLGLACAVILFFILLIFKIQIPKKYYIAAAVVFFVLVIITASYIKIFPTNFFSQRIITLTDLSTATFSLRIDYWLASLDAFSKQPWLGYGLENIHSVLAPYYQPRWSALEAMNTSPDRAHNEYLDTLLFGGVLLFSAFIILLAWLFRMILKSLPVLANESRILIIFLSSGLSAYLISLFFSFSSIETAPYFWLYIALILSAMAEFSATKHEFSDIQRRLFYFFVCFYACILPISLIYYNINNIIADHYFRKARISYAQQDQLAMLENYSKVFDYSNHSFYEWFFINDAIETVVNTPTAYQRQLLSMMNGIIANDPPGYDFSKLLRNAKVLTLKSKYENISFYSAAEASYHNLVRQSPYMPESYKSWAEFYILHERYDKAMIIIDTAFTVLPDIGTASSREHRQSLLDFQVKLLRERAYCQVKLSHYDQAVDSYKKILELAPFDFSTYKSLSDIYDLEKDKHRAIYYAYQLVKLEPHNYIRQVELSKLYYKYGDKKNFEYWAKQSLEYAPVEQKQNIEKMINSIY